MTNTHKTTVDYILGKTKFMPICEDCGPIGRGEDFEIDARAIAHRHTEIGGFEHAPSVRVPYSHLRATGRPEAELHGGHIFVWTECGEQTNAIFVDNEEATCPECVRLERLRQLEENEAENAR